MHWFALLTAGLFEVIWAYLMKLSNGFTHPIISISTLVCMTISFLLLAYAMRFLPLGTAYVIWTGIGAVGAFILGIVFLNEPVNAMRLIAATLIVSGIILMKLTTA